MSGLTLWMNREIERLKKEMDLLFDQMMKDFSSIQIVSAFELAPRITVSQEEDKVIVKAEIPHLKPEDVEVSITDDMLFISGRSTEEQAGEEGEVRRMGSLRSELRLPCKVKAEKANATYHDGILEIVLPKCPAEAKRLRITTK